jgi:hypothetical protein
MAHRENFDTTVDGREVITVEDFDLVTMKNLLYFLYTGRVNLHKTSRCTGPTHPENYPEPVDAFAMYRAANMYLLPDLEDRCYRYLSMTCSPENVCERLLGNLDCNCYPKLRKAYFDYLIQNFNEVKSSKGWKHLGHNLKQRSPELAAYQSKLLVKIASRSSNISAEVEESDDFLNTSSSDSEEDSHSSEP